jgi:hypothetical protein
MATLFEAFTTSQNVLGFPLAQDIQHISVKEGLFLVYEKAF